MKNRAELYSPILQVISKALSPYAEAINLPSLAHYYTESVLNVVSDCPDNGSPYYGIGPGKIIEVDQLTCEHGSDVAHHVCGEKWKNTVCTECPGPAVKGVRQ